MDREESSDSENVGVPSESQDQNWGLISNWGLYWGLRFISCSTLQPLGCHPCACKLFCINFPLNS